MCILTKLSEEKKSHLFYLPRYLPFLILFIPLEDINFTLILFSFSLNNFFCQLSQCRPDGSRFCQFPFISKCLYFPLIFAGCFLCIQNSVLKVFFPHQEEVIYYKLQYMHTIEYHAVIYKYEGVLYLLIWSNLLDILLSDKKMGQVEKCLQVFFHVFSKEICKKSHKHM